MKKLLLITTTIIVLSGCASSGGPEITTHPQNAGGKQNVFDWNSKVMSSDTEGQVTVDGIKSQFKNVTGNDLPAPERALSCTDPECYYALWSESYTTNMRIYRDHQDKAKQEKSAQCNANSECQRKAQFDQHLSAIKRAYQEAILTATPMYSGRADRMARALCNKAISAQANGVGGGDWVRSVGDAGLLDGQNPYGDIATSCWWMGFYGLKDANQVFN